VRATQDAAGLSHGSVRHHFGHRSAMVAALFDHLAEREGLPVQGDAADALEHLLGPDRTLTLARYKLFIMAARAQPCGPHSSAPGTASSPRRPSGSALRRRRRSRRHWTGWSSTR